MKLKEFQEKLRSCKYCKKILKMNFEPRPLVWGNQNAKIAQISQAPSFHASILGKPFSRDENTPDASGKQLLKWYDVPKEILTQITSTSQQLPIVFPAKTKEEMLLHQ